MSRGVGHDAGGNKTCLMRFSWRFHGRSDFHKRTRDRDFAIHEVYEEVASCRVVKLCTKSDNNAMFTIFVIS